METNLGSIINETSIYFWCSGCKINRKLGEYATEIEAFIDNNLEKQNKKIMNRDCISINEAKIRGGENATILVSPNNHEEIERQFIKW